MKSTYVILTFVVFCTNHYVSSTSECYADNIDTLPPKNAPSIQNCRSYMDTNLEKLGYAKGGLPYRAHCFTLHVETNKTSDNFRVKGCMPIGGCNTVKDSIYKELKKKKGNQIKSVVCFACSDNQCNRF